MTENTDNVANHWNGDGPLKGVRIIEMAGIGPVPFACMLLADMGAEIITIAAPSHGQPDSFMNMYDPMMRGRAKLRLNLKDPENTQNVLAIIRKADILVEGFRPGVMERLGLGPDECLGVNPALIYGRMTGYGQTGSMARAAGHDPNYIGMTGLLHSIGPRDGAPMPPLNVAGDFAGGSMYLALGVISALLCARVTGKGQIIDAAIVDGAASLLTMTHALRGNGMWQDTRESNFIDGGSPFSRSYQTADGGYIVIAAAEDKFYRTLITGMGFDLATLPDRDDRENWPALFEIFTARFVAQTRDEWVAAFADKDACLTPVLNLGEAVTHPHATARTAYSERNGTTIPGVAPRFSQTPSALAPDNPVSASALLESWNIATATIKNLTDTGANA